MSNQKAKASIFHSSGQVLSCSIRSALHFPATLKKKSTLGTVAETLHLVQPMPLGVLGGRGKSWATTVETPSYSDAVGGSSGWYSRWFLGVHTALLSPELLKGLLLRGGA